MNKSLLQRIHDRLGTVDTEIAVRALGNRLMNELADAVAAIPSASEATGETPCLYSTCPAPKYCTEEQQ